MLVTIFNMVCYRSIDIIGILPVILLLRYLLKGFSKRYICSLWIMLMVKMVLPFSIYLPYPQFLANTTEIPFKAEIIYVRDLSMMLSCIWLSGICILITMYILQGLHLKKYLSSSISITNHVRKTDNISTAFIFGIIKPYIYLPYDISSEDEIWILKHEFTHLEKKDYLVKIFFLLSCTIYWFNPLVWLCFRFFSNDLEMACDEKVVDKLDKESRNRYITTLFRLAGGEDSYILPTKISGGSLYKRISNLVNYEQNKKQIRLCFFVPFVIIAILLMTSFVHRVPDSQTIYPEFYEALSNETVKMNTQQTQIYHTKNPLPQLYQSAILIYYQDYQKKGFQDLSIYQDFIITSFSGESFRQ